MTLAQGVLKVDTWNSNLLFDPHNSQLGMEVGMLPSETHRGSSPFLYLKTCSGYPWILSLNFRKHLSSLTEELTVSIDESSWN